MYSEDDYLQLSGIQHFAFCRRQWALIHIEQQWGENYRTVDGSIMHENVHDAGFHEKRGEPKEDDCDILQLTAQALCLEDVLCCKIPFGYLYYGETRHRIKVNFDEELRRRTENVIDEMHKLYKAKHTPKVKRRKACNACSLKNICLPVICGNKNAAAYVKAMLGEEPPKER